MTVSFYGGDIYGAEVNRMVSVGMKVEGMGEVRQEEET